MATISVRTYGAIGDGQSRPLTARDAQKYNTSYGMYGLVVEEGDELDWAACQAALYYANVSGDSLYIPRGMDRYKLGRKPLTSQWTVDPRPGQPRRPRCTKIFGDGEFTILEGICAAGRAPLELLGESNGDSVNLGLEDLTLFLAPASAGTSLGAYCLRVGDSWCGTRISRVRGYGPNGLLLKVASSSSYANLCTLVEQSCFWTNYQNLWWANDNLATAFALAAETGGAFWDNVRITDSAMRGLCDCRAFALEFQNCQFWGNQNRPDSPEGIFSSLIQLTLGHLKVSNSYFEDYKVAITGAPYTADIRGVQILDSHFTGRNNFAGPQPERAIELAAYGTAGMDMGAVILRGNRVCSAGHTKKPIHLVSCTHDIADNFDIPLNVADYKHPRQEVQCELEWCKGSRSEHTTDKDGNPIGVRESTFPADTVRKLIASSTDIDAISTIGGVDAANVTSPYITAKRAGDQDIAGATDTNPVVVTCVAHGYTTGDEVSIAGVVGMEELNARIFTIAVTDDDHFSLDGVDGTSYHSYVSGGVVAKSMTSILWGLGVQSPNGSDVLMDGWASLKYHPGGVIPWVVSGQPLKYFPAAAEWYWGWAGDTEERYLWTKDFFRAKAKILSYAGEFGVLAQTGEALQLTVAQRCVFVTGTTTLTLPALSDYPTSPAYCVAPLFVVNGGNAVVTVQVTQGDGIGTAAEASLTLQAGETAILIKTDTHRWDRISPPGGSGPQPTPPTVLEAYQDTPLGLADSTVAPLASLEITAGKWEVQVSAHFIGSATTAVWYLEAFLGTEGGTSAAGRDRIRTMVSDAPNGIPLNGVYKTMLTQPFRIDLAEATTFYAKVSPNFSGGTLSAVGGIRAVRVG